MGMLMGMIHNMVYFESKFQAQQRCTNGAAMAHCDLLP
jgi:hypothetical protein